MKLPVVILPLVFALSLVFFQVIDKPSLPEKDNTDEKSVPGDWFYYQRAYPYNQIPYEKYFEAMRQKQQMERDHRDDAATWNSIGPSNIGGRVSAIVVDPANTSIIIIGGAAGGIFKTTNGGLNWSPQTDFVPSLSVGALEMDPTNPNIIYCGTGESNVAIDNYPGFGMLKSTDKGETWNLSGMADVLHIGDIEVHPLNPNIVYATGLSYRSPSQNKGIYKSTNAGAVWQRVLFVSDSTSGIDVDLDPADLNIVYGAMWERVRYPPSVSNTGGITSGLYRSTNGGANWTLLGPSNGLPGPSATTGRINTAVAKSNPNIVYALFRTTVGQGILGFFRSTDKGVNWTQMAMSGVSSGGFSWYFGLVEVDPTNPDRVYIGDVSLYRSTNGGNAFTSITSGMHVDQHILWINPANTNQIECGNDGGVYSTVTGGSSWVKRYDLPITQFYAATIDFLQPVRKIGGTQDNGTPRTLTSNPPDWQSIYGGDGFFCLVDYTNSNTIYAESQYGGIGRSLNGGSSFTSIQSGIDFSRTNWSTPYAMDVQNPNILYLGTYRLYRTTNQGTNWTAISPDLTRGPNGRLGTITAVSSAVLGNSERVLLVGTDDAKVSISTNTGTNWTDVTGTLPNRYVTDVLIDRRNPAVSYVTLSGFNMDLRNTHIFRTVDYGANWTNISANLINVPVNSIVIDYNRDSVLYIGCDAGVYYTANLGTTWNILGTGLPNSPVFDINFHQTTQKVVAATHGRSQWEIDVSVIGIEPISGSVPDKFALYQNYPNPFNASTKIKFVVPPLKGDRGRIVKLTIYDLLGREIITLVNQQLKPGTYEVTWNGKNYPSGVYFYKLVTTEYTKTKRMVLMK